MTQKTTRKRKTKNRPLPVSANVSGNQVQPINLDLVSSEDLGLMLDQQYQQRAQIDANIMALRATLNQRLQNNKSIAAENVKENLNATRT